jgi:hypothetical protein
MASPSDDIDPPPAWWVSASWGRGGELIAEAALAVETAVTAEDVATVSTRTRPAETLMGAAEPFRAGGDR